MPTVDPTLAQIAQVVQEHQGRSAKLHVIVYGPRGAQALAAVEAQQVRSLSLIHAVSAIVDASELGNLGLTAGVTYVNVDSPPDAKPWRRLEDGPRARSLPIRW